MSKTLVQILRDASVEDLHELRGLVLEARKVSTSGSIKRDFTDDHVQGAHDLADEIRRFGGNTLANIPRQGGPEWGEVVKDVADKIKADYEAGASVEDMEVAVVAKLFELAWDKMSEADQKKLLEEILPLLADENRRFGDNTLGNIPREGGPEWEEVVKDVADKIKADYEAGASVEDMEIAIAAKLFESAWDKGSEADRKKLLKLLEKILPYIRNARVPGGKAWTAGGSSLALQAVFRSGGFPSYKLLMIVVNAVVRQVVGVGLMASGLSLATNAALTRTAAVLVGPIGWTITGIITAIQVAGPSYKVTIRCVPYVAYLRLKQKQSPQESQDPLSTPTPDPDAPAAGGEQAHQTE